MTVGRIATFAFGIMKRRYQAKIDELLKANAYINNGSPITRFFRVQKVMRDLEKNGFV